ncbi:hypothetical protein KZX46_10430 [Polymorphobacter sp. PAMC 29334]|uniref:hypothetical protein n=1 Tax=Polymorphobacter sp. PAMC 29334 TaxID=2862331 RepID=UPI001C7520CA|nr:hypothetical protein [Polymorphobacter sp. PAMC 29334]QYE36299.1 hypothetical protein KZX46_10430 [Polymorphobacter sp. PAMC 29334]
MDDGDPAIDEMRAVTARWRTLCGTWMITPAEAVAMLGMAGPDETPFRREEDLDGVHVSERLMRLFLDLGDLLANGPLGPAGQARWLRTPSHFLAYWSPLDAMSGKPEAVRWFIDTFAEFRR